MSHVKICEITTVHGDWSTWSDWETCDCDSLKQNRTRQCGAMFGGSCVGPPVGVEGEIQTESRDCVNNTCPGNSVFPGSKEIIFLLELHIDFATHLKIK